MEDIKERINTAMSVLLEGLPFRIGDLFLGFDNHGCLNVTAASRSVSLKGITKQSALDELVEIKELFSKLLSMSDSFRTFVTTTEIQYNLDFDYGMGDIRICSERNGFVEWHYQINR